MEPSEVLWHNYHVSALSRSLRYLFSTGLCALSLVIRCAPASQPGRQEVRAHFNGRSQDCLHGASLGVPVWH